MSAKKIVPALQVQISKREQAHDLSKRLYILARQRGMTHKEGLEVVVDFCLSGLVPDWF